VHEIDGHNYEEIITAFDTFVSAAGTAKPMLIAAHTALGKGVSFMENDPKWHHGALSERQLAQALTELGLD